MNEWDPIGVRGVPEAADEYDRYVMPIYEILRNGGTEEEILTYLEWILQHMGLAGARRGMRRVVVRILKVDVSHDEPLE